MMGERVTRGEKAALFILIVTLACGALVRLYQRSAVPPALSVASFSTEEAVGEGISGRAASSRLVNINTARLDRLMRLKGVGRKLAEKIIEYRSQKGDFRSVDDLAKVRGIGPRILSENRSILRIDESE